MMLLLLLMTMEMMMVKGWAPGPYEGVGPRLTKEEFMIIRATAALTYHEMGLGSGTTLTKEEFRIMCPRLH